jgi:hypothetical protein
MTQLFVIGSVCFVSLVINFIVQKTPLWKWIGCGLSALALLTIITVIVLKYLHPN